MTERNRTAHLCSNACLHYELARAELWFQFHGTVYASELSGLTRIPSISEKTAAVALRHATCQFLEVSGEEILEQLHLYKRGISPGVFSTVDADRISLQDFTYLLESLELVANAEKVVEDVWRDILRIEGLLVACLLEAGKIRTSVELEESEAMEQIVSSWRRLEYAQMLRGQLEQRVHLATMRVSISPVLEDCNGVSLIQHRVRMQQRHQECVIKETCTRIERLDHVSNKLEILHEQFRVTREQEGILIKLARDEHAKIFMELSEESRSTRWEEQLMLMERELGIVGRFVIGLSVATLGRREHDIILRQLRDTAEETTLTAGNFTWLVEDDGTGSVSGYCDPSSLGSTSSLLQHCVLSPSCYKARDVAPETEQADATALEKHPDIGSTIRHTFTSLIRLNYMAIPFLQGYAATLDTVILFPPFELFVTMCELKIIGSAKLAFFSHCSNQLDAEIATYVKSLVREEDGWIVDYAMSYSDFHAFLSTQAAVEYAQHAHLLLPEALLSRIVEEVIVPRWLMHLKHPRSLLSPVSASTAPEDQRGLDEVSFALQNPEDSDNLYLLLDTALTWLEVTKCTLEDFAMAYRRHVVDYVFSTRPAREIDGITTTQVVMTLLFSPKAIDAQEPCAATSRWKALQQQHGQTFAELSELLGCDGSLDAVTGWLSIFIDSIGRDELMQRISNALKSIFWITLGGDVHPEGILGVVSSQTPVSWILTLAICVKLSFDPTIITPTLEDLFRFLTASH